MKLKDLICYIPIHETNLYIVDKNRNVKELVLGYDIIDSRYEDLRIDKIFPERNTDPESSILCVVVFGE